MFPIRDHNPSEGRPFVTWTLIAINIAIFLSYWQILSDDRATMAFFADWALIPAESRPLTFITSMFLHGGFMHLAGNMLFLWIFGDNLEDRMGHGPFLAFYLASGIGAGLLQVWAEAGAWVPMVGASGAIAGVMGGYLLLYPRAKVDVIIIFIVFFKIFTVPAFIMLGLWFALQLWSGSQVVAGSGGVAYWAHAGGFIVGFALCLPLWLRLGGPRFWSRTDGHPDHPAVQYATQRTSIPRVPRR